RASRRAEQRVSIIAPRGTGGDEDRMGPVEVVAERVRPFAGTLDVGAGQELLDEITPQPELGFGDAADVRELQREHRRRVFQHDNVVARLRRFGSADGDDSFVVVAGSSEYQQAV